MTPKFSKGGFFFAALAVIFYIGSMQGQAGLLFVLIGIMLGCLAANLWLSFWSLRGMDLEVASRRRISEGEQAFGLLFVRNLGARPGGFIDASVSKLGVVARVALVPPGSSVPMEPVAKFERRGVYRWRRLRIFSTFPFGLLGWCRREELPGEIIVHPRTCRCEPPAAAGFEPMVGGAHTGKHRSRAGQSFVGIRDYQAGDPIKTIDWKASAKRQTLMAREFSEELAGRVGIVVDTSNGKAGSLDWRARAAASLALAAVVNHCHVEMTATTSRPELLVRCPPFADPAEILDFLSLLDESADVGLDAGMAAALGRLSPRGAVALVAEAIDAAAAGVLADLIGGGRVVSVFLPVGVDDSLVPVGALTRRYDANLVF